MLKTTNIVCISLCAASLSACMSSQSPYSHQSHQSYLNQTGLYSNYYDEGYYQQNQQGFEEAQPKREVVVPDSYHVGRYHSPASHKDRDKRWVERQNPTGYTIELSRGSNAADVAGKLHKAPKNDRHAQIKYNRNGQSYYEGLYGSFPNYQAAKEALESLPEEVRQSADIKNWGQVQRQVQ